MFDRGIKTPLDETIGEAKVQVSNWKLGKKRSGKHRGRLLFRIFYETNYL